MKTPYETMFLLPSSISAEKVDEITERLRRGVEKKNGEILQIEKMGVRKTAYAINKQNSAFYVLVQFRGGGDAIQEMEKTLRNTDEVLKFLSTKITSTAPHAPVLGNLDAAASGEAVVEAPATDESTATAPSEPESPSPAETGTEPAAKPEEA